ncbi:MAG TPA: T9SS type A sorting domain-containing protein [Flavobacteriales bacterium]|nr:T9SS type A sorting domain-containing protein [Flavobacteriales bacterium]HMR26131.1 T9SS type A sorting domain-containing protein [Flavobacteriales bacterium]
MKAAWIILFALLLQSVAAQVQLERSLLATAGRTSSAAGISLDASLGDLVTMTSVSSGLIICQGFQQTVPDFTTALNEEVGSGITLYPNPARDDLFVRSAGVAIGTLTLSDAAGREMPVRILRRDDGYALDLSGLAEGPYFLRIHLDQHLPMVVKVIKQH